MVCVSAHRTLGLRPFDVQLAAGVILHEGAVAELATGEGKTLSAACPVFLNALLGKGTHVTTVNDYLAKRDAEWMGPVYETLGLSVGFLQQKMPDAERKQMYLCDITHGTASEFGFDYLRDKLRLKGQGPGKGGSLLATVVAGTGRRGRFTGSAGPTRALLLARRRGRQRLYRRRTHALDHRRTDTECDARRIGRLSLG